MSSSPSPRLRCFVSLLVGAVLFGCAPLPPQTASRGLYRDLRKTVEFRENDDWVIDDLEVADALSGVMRSICSTQEAAREDLELWLATEIERRGGPSRLQFERNGASLNRSIRETRRLERITEVLRRGRDEARRCPYWIAQDEAFAGLEGDEGRFVVLLESRGGASLLFADGEAAIGGGGGGRLFLGGGIGPRLTLAVGAEVAVDGELPEEPGGRRSFQAVLAAGAPLLLRIANNDRVIDFEAAYTARFADDTRHGVRFTVGYGLTTPRVSSFMPYAVLWVGYRVVPAAHGLPIEHGILFGTRIGFDWDP